MLSLLIANPAVPAVAEGVAASPALAPLGFPTTTVLIFVGAFIGSLIIDLIQHKSSQEISISNAVGWSIFWILLSLCFYGWVHYEHGERYASLFLTGYVLEKVLSVDNLIVFIAVFKYFNIRDVLQHKILYYGILGAIIFRAIFVLIGATMLEVLGPWAELIFGVLIAYAAFQMLGGDDDEDEKEPDYEEMFLVRMFNKLYPIFPGLVGNRFLISRKMAEKEAADKPNITLADGVKRFMTPAFVCLLVIEGSDVMFAFDSVPAVISVTREPLLVYSAMIFAILGLRSLYFVLVALTKFLVHLETAVLWVLVFIALKMFMTAAHGFGIEVPFEIGHNLSLYIVLGMIGLGVIASLIWPGEEEEEEA